MRHLMSPLDFSVEELDQLMDLANDIEKNPEKYAHACDGKRLATLFYEPSTRTRLSFEAAMMNLGGTVLGFSSANSSSASKGESVADTIRVVSCFANICAMRHPKEGAPLVASMYSRIPVINAGDGGHQHPTQTLTRKMQKGEGPAGWIPAGPSPFREKERETAYSAVAIPRKRETLESKSTTANR